MEKVRTKAPEGAATGARGGGTAQEASTEMSPTRRINGHFGSSSCVFAAKRVCELRRYVGSNTRDGAQALEEEAIKIRTQN